MDDRLRKPMPIEDALRRRRFGVVQVLTGDAREQALREQEAERRSEIERRRMYLNGEQYDQRNRDVEKQRNLDPHCLPEHLKLQAYSTQIQESVEFIASQLSESFVVKAEDDDVQQVLMDALVASPALSGGQDTEEDLSITNVLRDALTAGDTPVLVRWDPISQRCWYEVWASEEVEFRYSETNRYRLESVILTETVWEMGTNGSLVELPKFTTWEMRGPECVKVVQIDDRAPSSGVPIGLPFIPWRLIRGNLKDLKKDRGESVITKQSMSAADRYNAVEQAAWLIARYNSHANLAVIGDSSNLALREDNRLNKDVADVLTFPGGTNLQVIELPTDPEMIEHQRQVLLDSLYGAFGLVRMDQTTIEGLGRVSGYALEILNRKSEGTFSQIGKQVKRDLRGLFNLTLDVFAYMAAPDTEDDVDEDEDEATATESQVEVVVTLETFDLPNAFEDEDDDDRERRWNQMMAVEPTERFPRRRVEITMGTGYIVDDVLVREDFVAGLTSRRDALRARGKSPDDIGRIEREIKAEKKAATPVEENGLSAAALAAAQAASAGEGAENGTRVTTTRLRDDLAE